MIETILNGQSLNIEEENIQKLKQLFPEIVTEDKVDFNRLQDVLGNYMERTEESYRFTWFGKSDAFRKSQAPSTGTLRPCVEDSKDFDTTQNLYIEGDNLEVLKLLQKSYNNKVKLIYIDPPYNKDKDFVYPDKWSDPIKEYKRITGQLDDEDNVTSSDTEGEGGKHTNWLNMMYPRLRLARNLLTDDGVIFISIDNAEIENLKKLCNEVFGEENFIECITWNKRVPKNDKGIGNIHEYILIYVKNSKYDHKFTMPKEGIEEINELLLELKNKKTSIEQSEKELKKLYEKKGYDRGITLYNSIDENYEAWGKINMSWPNGNSFGPSYDVLHPKTRKPVKVPDRGWRWKEETFTEQLDYENTVELYDGSFMCGGIWFAKDENTQPSSIKYLKDVDTMLLRSIISLKSDGGIEVENLFNGKSYFSYPKPTDLIKYILNSCEDKSCIYMDFFSGSGTTADAVMSLNAEDNGNRKYVMVQLPENLDDMLSKADSTSKKAIEETIAFLNSLKKPHNICELGKERIRRAGESIKEELKAKFEAHQQKQQSLLSEEEQSPMNPDDLDIGFKVFKLDSSNLKKWAVDVGENFYKESKEDQNEYLAEQLEMEVDNFVASRTELDMVYEIMLKYGLDLTYPIEIYNFDGKNVYSIGFGGLIVILDRELTESLADNIVGLVNETQPNTVRVAVRDLSFSSDDAKTNFKETLKNGVTSYFEKVDDKADKENQFEFITI